MKRYYIDVNNIIHTYYYNKDNMITKAKCNNCHKKMNYLFGNNLGKHTKIGFVCFACNIVYASEKFELFKCKISLLPIKRIK